jgi:hypothetical protein
MSPCGRENKALNSKKNQVWKAFRPKQLWGMQETNLIMSYPSTFETKKKHVNVPD